MLKCTPTQHNNKKILKRGRGSDMDRQRSWSSQEFSSEGPGCQQHCPPWEEQTPLCEDHSGHRTQSLLLTGCSDWQQGFTARWVLRWRYSRGLKTRNSSSSGSLGTSATGSWRETAMRGSHRDGEGLPENCKELAA
jgi:hypothetical protein